MDLVSAVNATVEIQRRSQSKDAGGSFVTAWATIYHKLPVFIQQNRHAEVNQGGGERQSINGIAKLPGECTPQSGDRIIWQTRVLQITAMTPVQDVAEIVEEWRVEWEEVSNAGL